MRYGNAAPDRIGLKNPPSNKFDGRECSPRPVFDCLVFGIEQKVDIDMTKMWGVSALTLRRAMALMPLAALAASIERAEAACDAISPIATPITVTCTGTTTNANGNTGFGSNNDSGSTYNVVSGASVTGLSIGLLFNDGTVNVAGNSTITGDLRGIQATTLATVNN